MRASKASRDKSADVGEKNLECVRERNSVRSCVNLRDIQCETNGCVEEGCQCSVTETVCACRFVDFHA